MNFLEQLVSEWYEFQGYFVRRNVRIGLRANGGYEGELDVLALHPGKKRLLHIETSMYAGSWEKRDCSDSRLSLRLDRNIFPHCSQVFRLCPQ